MADGCDVLIGCIANDRMFVVLDRFFKGDITDEALIRSLSALKLGKQSVAILQSTKGMIGAMPGSPNLSRASFAMVFNISVRKKAQSARLHLFRFFDKPNRSGIPKIVC